MELPEIVITVEGGVIQDVQFPPDCPRVRVIVLDFDTDGIDPSTLYITDDGDGAIHSSYEGVENDHA